MFVRCFKCRGVTWVEGDCRQHTVIDCSNCSLPLRFRNITTQDTRTRFKDAVCFAEASGIDLPSANSVLLGVMTLREALSIQGKSAAVPSGGPSPMELAADEAMRALELERAKRVVLEATLTQPRIPEEHSRVAWFAACGMLLASIGLGVVGWNSWSREIASARVLESRPAPKEPETTQPVGSMKEQRQQVLEVLHTVAHTRRDREAQVVQIVGRSPEAVLRTFCAKTGEPGRYEALELATTNPQRIGARLGILRDYQDLSQTYAIWIQQRRTDRKWIAGSGKEPLTAFPLDDRVGDTKIELSTDETDQPG